MHRIKILCAAGIVSAVLGAGAGVALADTPGVEFRPAPNAASHANCVGLASAAATHNGQAVTLGQGGDPSHGARGDEIKAFQASCQSEASGCNVRSIRHLRRLNKWSFEAQQ